MGILGKEDVRIFSNRDKKGRRTSKRVMLSLFSPSVSFGGCDECRVDNLDVIALIMNRSQRFWRPRSNSSSSRASLHIIGNASRSLSKLLLLPNFEREMNVARALSSSKRVLEYGISISEVLIPMSDDDS